jgi:hypothetical protein
VPAEDIDTLAGEPDEADAYARRGAARLTRGDPLGDRRSDPGHSEKA